MATGTLNRVQKIEQVAALMLLVFKANPKAVMTRRDIESMLDLDGFSVSTRHGALNWLASQGHIKSGWPTGSRAMTWRLSDPTTE
jgi:hypothetical protein